MNIHEGKDSELNSQAITCTTDNANDTSILPFPVTCQNKQLYKIISKICT